MDDRPWEKIEGLDFYPWKGANYERSVFGIRILVMGESTYFTPEDPQEVFDHQCKKCEEIKHGWFAHYNVFAYRQGKWQASFWTKWINGLLGREARLDERQTVLDSVAFWNYADGRPLERHSTAPNEDVLGQANGKLRLVIDHLRPDLVILLSSRLWPKLSEGKDAFKEAKNVCLGTTCEVKVGEIRTRLLGVCHPRRFSIAGDWCAIKQAVKEARGRQPEARTDFVAPPKKVLITDVAPHQLRVYSKHHAWVFDDETCDVKKRPFAHGVTMMIDELIKNDPTAADGFYLRFSSDSFEGHTTVLKRIASQNGQRKICGTWYQMDENHASLKACICKDLTKYFKKAPDKIFCEARPEGQTASGSLTL
ncbi:MAG TPA: hypothetical protein VE959_37830 [Bryobacteraceae bacterium]|nr:hypothetical protein [Bryobacteraceae bacterium]